MASIKTLVTIKRGGREHPPGSVFHDFTDDEIADLREHVEHVEGEAPEDDEGGEPEVDEAEDEAESDEDGDEDHGEDEGGEPEDEPASDAPEAEKPKDHIAEIVAAIDLLDAKEDFTSKGRPKFEPLTAILGFKPTGAEVTAALALRAEEGL